MSSLPYPTPKYQKILKNLHKLWQSSQNQAYRLQKPLTYWQMGQKLAGQQNKLKPLEEEALFKALMKDLKIERSHFYRLLKLYQTWPQGLPPRAIKAGFSWSHFRQLITLSNIQERNYYIQQAVELQWNFTTLKKAIDHQLYQSQDKAKTRKSMLKLKRHDERLHFYTMEVTRVIDGDTIEGIVNVGFHMMTERKFRLKGINTAEIKGQRGKLAKKAKQFVSKKLENAACVVVKTYKTDLHGRYVAYLFYHPVYTQKDKVAKDGYFLNQELLDAGLAELYLEGN